MKTVETYAKEMTDDEIGVEVVPIGLSASGKSFKFGYRFYVREKLYLETFFSKKVYSDDHDIWIGEKGRYYYIRYSSVVTGEVLYNWEGKDDPNTKI